MLLDERGGVLQTVKGRTAPVMPAKAGLLLRPEPVAPEILFVSKINLLIMYHVILKPY
jgi:hypothetical protein